MLRRQWQALVSMAAVVVVPYTVGCGSVSGLRSPARFERGLIVVLPGVEGRSPLNTSVAKGLQDGGVPSAVEIHNWTLGPSFLSAVVNLRAENHNRNEAQKVAQRIVNYQDKYPGRPVHIIGHSGGGGIAVWVLEALPAGHEVTGAILLAPAISPDYDLRLALKRTRNGIYNFYSPYDVGFLKFGTRLAGTIDGQHTRAAGAVGFSMPWGLSQEDRQLYSSRLHQQRYIPKMADSGHSGGHFGWANRTFVAEWLASLINAQIDTQTRYAADTQDG